MQTIARGLLLSVALSGASLGFAAPVQAHHTHNDVWPNYGLTGLILWNYESSHHHHYGKNRYYDDYRLRYKHRRHRSYGRKKHYRHTGRGKCRHKHKPRRADRHDD